MSDIIIEDYSDKAIAIFGDTKSIKDKLLELKGKFNPSLRGNGDEKRAGWIFPKTKKDEIKKMLEEYKSNPSSFQSSTTDSKGPHIFENKKIKKDDEFVFTKEMYLSLLTRIEKQETELLLYKKIIDKLSNGNSNNVIKPTLTNKKIIINKDESNDEVSDESENDEEIKKPMKNLLVLNSRRF
jgi:hypothetical protein